MAYRDGGAGVTPHFSDEWLTVYAGDCREVLPALEADSVDCIVTSPPYWGLRDYGTEGQLGLEATPELYVANLVAVFRELRRVLKPSGTCWLNLGDSYASGNRGGYHRDGERGYKGGPIQLGNAGSLLVGAGGPTPNRLPIAGLKDKDLVGIPWRVAFALQADGWYLRSDIIWAKPNPMPESVTDRPTKAHEYLFLLTKSARYFYDADGIRETYAESSIGRYDYPIMSNPKELAGGGRVNGARNTAGMKRLIPEGRNSRSVWTIATRPYPGAHFAVFPPELPERCIKAGSSERGVCPECGAPWERVVERTGGVRDDSTRSPEKAAARKGMAAIPEKGWETTRLTTGWLPSCEPLHDNVEHRMQSGIIASFYPKPVPAVILDPFAGSGTVGLVAQKLSRRAILIDLNPNYISQQMRRNAQTPLGLPA